MPLYFFSLTETAWPYYSGEDLPNDEAAKAHGQAVEAEVSKNRADSTTVRIFTADGRRIA